jgi:hypothetical protein
LTDFQFRSAVLRHALGNAVAHERGVITTLAIVVRSKSEVDQSYDVSTKAAREMAAAGVDIVVLGGVPINLSKGYVNAEQMIVDLEADQARGIGRVINISTGRCLMASEEQVDCFAVSRRRIGLGLMARYCWDTASPKSRTTAKWVRCSYARLVSILAT